MRLTICIIKVHNYAKWLTQLLNWLKDNTGKNDEVFLSPPPLLIYSALLLRSIAIACKHRTDTLRSFNCASFKLPLYFLYAYFYCFQQSPWGYRTSFFLWKWNMLIVWFITEWISIASHHLGHVFLSKATAPW